MVAPSSKFTAKFGLVFVLRLKNAFSQRFHFNTSRMSIGSSKKRFQGFSKQPPFKRSAWFYLTISEHFKRFQYFITLKQIFWKTKTFFKKLEYCFLVESIKIESASFPYKTAISEANVINAIVKTNKMVTTKWTYHIERSFASNYFIFLKILFQFKNLF